MIEWKYIVISLCLLLLFFLIAKEIRRANKVRLAWRLLATIFAVTSLACLALPITYHHAENAAINHEAVLLTGGFNHDSVNQFISAKDKNIPVVTLEKNLKDVGTHKASYISTLLSLSEEQKNINTLHVFGYGLEKDGLDALKNVNIVFHPTELLRGITSIDWDRNIKAGEKLFIQGTINNATTAKAKVVLKSFNSTLDSVNVPTGKNQHFQLTTIPKHTGRSVYSIVAVIGNDTIEKEFVPVEVEQGESIKLLMLASSPDFDNKFLKDRLAQNGYEVVARTAISKNKYVKDFLNTATIAVDRITSSLLDNFDVVIADASELTAMSKSELATTQAQVARKSLGLLVKVDSAFSSLSFYASPFPLIADAGSNQQPLNVYVADSTSHLPAINVENPLFIRHQPGTQPIVIDKQNRVFANSTLYGSGKIILTTLANTYSWALAGYQDDYDKFWAELLNKAAPKQALEEVWTVSPALPEINKPVQLQVQTNSSKVPQGQVGEATVYLKQNPALPYQWTGTYLPVKAGWQAGIELNGKSFYWYAYDKNDWSNIKAMKRIEATKEYMSYNDNLIKESDKEVKMMEKEVPKVLFFLSFLLFAGFLWFENKM